MKAALVMVALLAGCDTTEDEARSIARKAMGPNVSCVHDSQYKSTGVSFCTDGHSLAICTGDGCITVDIPQEKTP